MAAVSMSSEAGNICLFPSWRLAWREQPLFRAIEFSDICPGLMKVGELTCPSFVLERLSYDLSREGIAAVSEAALGIGGRNGIDRLPDSHDKVVEGTSGLAPQVGLDLGEDLLDRIEVGGVGRQEPHLTPHRFDLLPNLAALMDIQIVEDHGLAGVQGGNEDLLPIGGEEGAVGRSFLHIRGVDAGRGQGRQEGHIRAVVAGDDTDRALPPWRPCPLPGHRGMGTGFVEEDEGCRVERGRFSPPSGAGDRIPLMGYDRLFLSGNANRCSSRHMVASLTWTP